MLISSNLPISDLQKTQSQANVPIFFLYVQGEWNLGLINHRLTSCCMESMVN
jgi:hypothetical protein